MRRADGRHAQMIGLNDPELYSRTLIFPFSSPTIESVPSSCKVSFTDGEGVSHSVTLAASSLYEAAALAVAEFKKSGFEPVDVGPGAKLTIAVEAPAMTHELTVGKLEAWLST